MMAVSRSFWTRSAITSALSALGSSGNNSAVSAMTRVNHIRPPESPTNIEFGSLFAVKELPSAQAFAPHAPAPNRGLPRAPKAAPASAASRPRAELAIERNLPPGACSSPSKAGHTVASAQLVRVTHPFHPLADRQLVCVGERHNRSGKRLLLRIDDSTICSVPPQWTDAAAPDPEVVIGRGRALLRVIDLMGLARLVEQFSARRHGRDV